MIVARGRQQVAAESESEPNNHAMSRATERFLRRAQTILDDPTFTAALKRTRREWNRDWPAYKIGPLHPRTPNQADLTEEGLPLPRRLAETVRLWRDGLREQPGAPHDQGGEDAPDVVVTDWEYRTHMLAHEGWPAHIYPDWRGSGHIHPAQRFVAACLVWKPQQIIPEEWIDPIPYTALIQSLPFDPTIPAAIPEVLRWKTAFEWLSALLRMRATEGIPLPAEEIAGLIEEAQHEGDEMANAAAAYAAKVYPEGYRFISMPQGINSTDLRAIERIITHTKSATGASDPRREEARRLRAEGMSDAQIAKRIGVSTKAIRDWDGPRTKKEGGSS